MKRFCLILYSLFLITVIKSQPEWVSFNHTNPSAPYIQILNSSKENITFSVEVPGMTRELMNHTEFYRLSIPGGGKTDYPGFPEMPFIRKLVAIPQCSNITTSIILNDSLFLDNYLVYPAPTLVHDTSGLIEQFTINDSIYQTENFYPDFTVQIKSIGFIRDQRIAEILIYPISFNPARRELRIYDNFEISLIFDNPRSEVNVDIGLFNDLAKNCVLNYNIPDHSKENAQKHPMRPTDGGGNVQNVQWITLTDTAQAHTIVADYIIITDDQFFYPHNQELQKIADHRKVFNGFDVAIVNVGNILALNFKTYIHPPLQGDPATFINEEKIRTFIQRVFDGKNANHTFDSHLGYILLVGDARFDVDNGSVSNLSCPTSYSLYPGVYNYDSGPYPAPKHNHTYNDYYFSCITKTDPNTFDNLGDLLIGRFCVDTPDELNNMVEKAIKYETEPSFENKHINLITRSNNIDNDPKEYFNNYYVPFFKGLTQQQPSYYQTLDIYPHDALDDYWKTTIVEKINNGLASLYHYGHALKDAWVPYSPGGPALPQYNLTNAYLHDYLSNNYKNPFVFTSNCNSGLFVDPVTGLVPPCMGEYMTRYSQTMGYIGYVGCTDECPLGCNFNLIYPDPSSFPPKPYSPTLFNEWLPYLIWHDLSHEAGKTILTAKLNSNEGLHMPFNQNYFGDPALILFTEGFQVTHDITLSCNAVISNQIYVTNGARLIIPPGCSIYLNDGGELIIEPGSELVIGDNSHIYAENDNNWIDIEGGLIYGNPYTPPQGILPITNVTFQSYANSPYWHGIEFWYPANSTVEFNHCTFTNCNLLGRMDNISFTNSCDFTNTNIAFSESNFQLHGTVSNNSILTNSSVDIEHFASQPVSVQIDNCTFSNTDNTMDAVLRIIGVESFNIFNNTFNYNNSTGIDLINCGWNGSSHII